MAFDVTGFGAVVTLTASGTFPSGVDLSQFADDADPFDIPAIDIANTAMGVNGDLIRWGVATPIAITLNVIPNSDDDVNLSILHEANRNARGKVVAKDDITINVAYPDGTVVTLSSGVLMSGPVAPSLASAGRLKTNAYVFNFESVSKT
jgi:hypothetical protein